MLRQWCRSYSATRDFATAYLPWVAAEFSGILCVDEVYQGKIAILLAVDPCPGRFVCPSALRGSLIRVVEATEHREGPHGARTARMHRGCRRVAGDVLPDPLMRPILVEVGHVLPEHAPQVDLAQHHDVVQALAPDAAEEPRAGGVLPGRAVRRPQYRDAGGGGDAGEGRPVFAVAIADEVARPRPEGRGLAQLLGDPGIRGMARDPDVDYPARIECDDEEGVERTEEHVSDREEVAGPGLRGVVAQERRPGLVGPARRARVAHVPLDRGLGDPDAELAQRTPDPLGTPQPIRRGHLLDEGDRPGRHLRLRC